MKQMKRIVQYFLKRKILVFLAILYFILQIIYLNQSNLLRGERDIVFTGYSLARTAKDLYGNFLPLQFNKLDMPTPFLSFYYSALFWLIIPFKNIFFARLPFVIASFSLIFLVYEIVKHITKNEKVSLLTAFVFNFSPGIFHLTRLSLEINIAMPLLLFGTLFYLKKKKGLSYLFFTLTFFSYNGFRPLILPLLIYLEFYFYLNHRQNKQFIINTLKNIVFFLLIFSISFFFIDGKMMTSRKNDLIFLSYEKINPKVIFRRNTAIGPEILKKIFNNKLTATAYYVINVFFKGQGLSYLFLKGDPAAIYATTFTGQFFTIGLLFYYLGFLYLGKIWNKNYLYLIGIIPISLIPSLINIDYISIAIRSMPASIGYAFIIACGIVFFFQLLKIINKKYQKLILTLLFITITLDLSYFVYNYYFRRPITMFESYFESEKQIARYLLSNKKKKYKIYDDSPRNIFATYYFINPNKINMSNLQKKFKKGFPYNFDNKDLYQCPNNIESINLKPPLIIADSCLGKKLYDKLNSNLKITKIKFKDFSLRTAFFILNK